MGQRMAIPDGWSVWFDPSVAIVHHRPLHSRPVPPHLRLITRHALLTYARKHWPAWQLGVLGRIIHLESGLRRLVAWWRGDEDAGGTFAEMGRLAGDFVRDEKEQARARLGRVVRLEEQQRAGEPVDRHPLPQPARPAGAVSGQRRLLYAAWDGSPGRR